MEICVAYYKSPLGLIKIEASDEGVEKVEFEKDDLKIQDKTKALNEYASTCIRELEEYFNGTRKEFTVKLHIKGTEFQKKVWSELMKIPYGKTVSYKYIAEAIENPRAVRAVGGANNKNNIAIIIPCHRVIGVSGKLIGYGGGLDKKEFLLKHEGIKL